MRCNTFSLFFTAATAVRVAQLRYSQRPKNEPLNICYFTNWAQYRTGAKFLTKHIPPELCTHINYAFADVTDDGSNVVTQQWNDETLYKEIMNIRDHQNPKLKVVLSVGGWTHGTGGFHFAAKTDSSRRTFAQNALNFVRKYDFDGIDIDWEYPGYTLHYAKPGKLVDVKNYVAFIKILKEVFTPYSLLVTAAVGVPPQRVEDSYTQTKEICDTLDLIHLMSYDFHGGWEKYIGHHSPWTSDGTHPNDKDNHLTVKYSTENWIKRGCDPSKMTLGLGAYGRVFRASGQNKRTELGSSTGVKGRVIKWCILKVYVH